MKYQPNADYQSDDVVMTPFSLCLRLIQHFAPTGVYLEPCYGTKNFLDAAQEYNRHTLALTKILGCEVKDKVNFLHFNDKADYIITNPPWSKITEFLEKSFQVSDNVVFLMTINHAYTAKRRWLAKEYGFAIKEIVELDWPENFPKSGFALGVVHYQRGWCGGITETDWTTNSQSRKRSRFGAGLSLSNPML